MRLAICLPSRGLVHSRTIEDILENLDDCIMDYKFFMAHGVKIPDAHNKVLREALKWGANYIWFVEEDMQLPKGILNELIEADTLVATADYPVGKVWHVIDRLGDEQIMRAGFGCTMFKAELFKKIKPQFSSERSYTLPRLDTVTMADPDKAYGGHDVDFFIRLKREHDIEPTVVNMTAGQYNVLEKGNHENNIGFQTVEVWRFDESNTLREQV